MREISETEYQVNQSSSVLGLFYRIFTDEQFQTFSKLPAIKTTRRQML